MLAWSDDSWESTASWRSVPEDLAVRGPARLPALATGDGALGFWAALAEAWPDTRGLRCGMHQTATALNELPKSIQGKAKAHLQEIWGAETRVQAEQAVERFVRDFAAKHPKAVEKLAKDHPPDRVGFCRHSTPHDPHQELRVSEHIAGPSAPVGPDGGEVLAQAEWVQTPRRRPSRRSV